MATAVGLGLLLCGLTTEPAAAIGEPTNTSPPVITGTAKAGRTLTVSNGEWDSLLKPVTYSRQWYRSSGPDFVEIVGATDSSYTLTGADIGHQIVALVTAENTLGKSTKDSNIVGPVADNPPVNTSKPNFSGTPQEGKTLSVGSSGDWSSEAPFSYAYQWRRCDSGGGACSDIPGATSTDYTLVHDDVGSTIRLRVRAAGAYGTGIADSDQSSVVRRKPSTSPGTNQLPGANPPGPGQTPSGFRRLSPFPRIVIAGRVARIGAFLSEVSVRGPRGVTVRVSCRGVGCPWRRRAYRMRSRRLRIRALQRVLGAGTVLEFRVVRRGRIGKYTRVTIRRNRVPARVDRCLYPGSSRPRHC